MGSDEKNSEVWTGSESRSRPAHTVGVTAPRKYLGHRVLPPVEPVDTRMKLPYYMYLVVRASSRSELLDLLHPLEGLILLENNHA